MPAANVNSHERKAGNCFMMFVTGDTHIPIDISKLNARNFEKQKELTKKDYVIICGDFGGVWTGTYKDDYWLDWLEAKNFTTLFVDGNHENFDALADYDECSWNGGKVQYIRPSVIHLMRGYIYDVEGMSVFTMGGARSTDKAFRREGVSWWPQEMPSAEEFTRARQNLALHDNQVDLIITHDAPLSFVHMMRCEIPEDDALMPFLEDIKNTVGYRHWYFGHFHLDWRIDESHTAIYQKIIQL